MKVTPEKRNPCYYCKKGFKKTYYTFVHGVGVWVCDNCSLLTLDRVQKLDYTKNVGDRTISLQRR